MAKEANTESKFTNTTTTDSKTTNFSTVEFFCKYYLPCGRCDKTGELCSNAQPVIKTYPMYPWWKEPYYKWYEPSWIYNYNDYTFTCEDSPLYYTTTTTTSTKGE